MHARWSIALASLALAACGGDLCVAHMGADKSSAGVDGTWLWVRDGDNYLGTNRTAAGLADGSAFNPLYLEKLGQMRSIRWGDTLDSASVTEWNTRTQLADNWLDSDRGAPIEVLVAICNRAQVDCWFSIPAQATDGYLRGLAEYLRDNLDPGLIARIEIGDEYWNGRAQYALAQCQARWNVTDWCAAEWAGMRLAQACDIFKNEVFGATGRHRVRCVVVAQAGNSGVGQQAIECPLWVNEGNQVCWQHGFDEYAVSRFFSGNVDSWTTLESQGAAGVDQAVDLLAADVTANMAADVAADLDLAQSHGLVFTAYSMGIDLGYNQTGATAEFRRQVARHPRMQQVYADMLSRWKALGGTLFHHYVDVRGGDGSVYGLLETVEDDTPRWRAIADWSRTVPCWWPGCTR